jgi:hypothetical protein
MKTESITFTSATLRNNRIKIELIMKHSCLTNTHEYANSWTSVSFTFTKAKRSLFPLLYFPRLFFLFVLFIFFAACSDGDKPAINGLWQLKSIEDTGSHTVQPVDTVFYAFQRQSIFSYIRLQENENQPSVVIYGFIDFPTPDHLHILLDKNYYETKSYVPWKDTSVIYDIIRLDAKRLTLSQNGTFYYFNKY